MCFYPFNLPLKEELQMYNFFMLFIFSEPVQKPHIFGGSGSVLCFFLQAALAPRGQKHAALSGSGSSAPDQILLKFNQYRKGIIKTVKT